MSAIDHRSILFTLLVVVWTTTVVAQNPDGLPSILIDDASDPAASTPAEPTGAVAPADQRAPADVALGIQPAKEAGVAADEFEELPEALPTPPPLPDPNLRKPTTITERRGPVDRSEARSHALGISAAGGEAGLKVVGIISGGPADQAGMRLGDFIQSIDGVPVYSANELVKAANTKRGETVQLNIVRDGQPLAATVQLGESGVVNYRVPSIPQNYRRRVTVRAPGIRIETEAGVSSSSARITVTPRSFVPPPILPPWPGRRAIRLTAPPIPPVGPPIGPPPRFYRPGRFGW